MDEERREDFVARAREILLAEGFPIEQIRILPAEGAAPAADAAPRDRREIFLACCELLEDGESRSAKDLARLLHDRLPGLTRKEVNSVLAGDARERVFYDRETYTYRLRIPGED